MQTSKTHYIIGKGLLLLLLFNGLFSRTTWVSWYQKGKSSLDLNEARDDGVLGCSGISWTPCIQSAPRSSQITTPTSHNGEGYMQEISFECMHCKLYKTSSICELSVYKFCTSVISFLFISLEILVN